MAYYLTESSVKRNEQLLAQIQATMESGNEMLMSPAPNQSPSAAKYWIRNLLASARQYPSYGYAELADTVVVSILDDGRIRLYPTESRSRSTPVVLDIDEFAALGQLVTSNRFVEEAVFKPSDDYDADGLTQAAHEMGWEVTLTNLADGRIELTANKIESRDNEPNPFDVV